MFMTGVATKGHMNAWVQSHHLLPCWSLRIAGTRTISVTCAAPCGHDVVCLNCCHVSVYPTRVKVCVDVQDLGYHRRQGRCLGSGPATKKLALARTAELPQPYSLTCARTYTHTHTLRNDFPTHHHGSERAALCLREAIPVAGNLNCHPGTHPCLGVGTPQHLPHLRFVGVFKGTAGFS